VSYDAIDAYVEGEMHRLKVPCLSLAVVEGDQIVHLRGSGLRILLPLISNLLFALTLIPMADKKRGYHMLYKPDSSWIVLLGGSFALVWSLVRTALVLRAPRRRPCHE
jgi:hypothetical protein